MTVGIGRVMQDADVDLEQAIMMATARPARAIGISDYELCEGARANLIVFELPAAPGAAIRIRKTINHGQVVYDCDA